MAEERKREEESCGAMERKSYEWQSLATETLKTALNAPRMARKCRVDKLYLKTKRRSK